MTTYDTVHEMSYGSVPLTYVGLVQVFRIFRLVNPATGTNTLQARVDGNYNVFNALVAAFENANTANPNQEPIGQYYSATWGGLVATPTLSLSGGQIAIGAARSGYDSLSAATAGTSPIGAINVVAFGSRTTTGTIGFTKGANANQAWAAGLVVNPASATAASLPVRRRSQSNLLLL